MRGFGRVRLDSESLLDAVVHDVDAVYAHQLENLIM